MPIAEMQQQSQQQAAHARRSKGTRVALDAFDRVMDKIETTMEKGRETVQDVVGKAATTVDDWSKGISDTADIMSGEAAAAERQAKTTLARGEDNVANAAVAAVSPSTKAAAKQPIVSPTTSSASSSSSSAAEDDDAGSPSKRKLKRKHLKIKSPGTIKAEMKQGLAKIKNKLETFAENVRSGTAAKEKVSASDAFLGPSLSPTSLAAKKRRQEEKDAKKAEKEQGKAQSATGKDVEQSVGNLVGTVGAAISAAANAAKAPMRVAQNVTRTLNEVLPAGTIPDAITAMLPTDGRDSGAPDLAGGLDGTRHPKSLRHKFEKFMGRVKFGVYLLKHPSIIKTALIAVAVFVVALLMGSGALIMHLVDRRLLST